MSYVIFLLFLLSIHTAYAVPQWQTMIEQSKGKITIDKNTIKIIEGLIVSDAFEADSDYMTKVSNKLNTYIKGIHFYSSPVSSSVYLTNQSATNFPKPLQESLKQINKKLQEFVPRQQKMEGIEQKLREMQGGIYRR